MFMSEEQMVRLTKYPHTLLLDVTHLEGSKAGAAGANATSYQLISGLVVDSKSESTPVFQVGIRLYLFSIQVLS